MSLPFSVAQFLGVFEEYNQAIWPVQLVAYAAGLGVVALVLAGSRHAGTVASAVLAAMWLGMGVGYHIAFFSDINPAAFAFGAFFIVQALSFAWHGVVRRRLVFDTRPGLAMGLGLAAVVYGVIAYPLIGAAAGHSYPAAPVFGVAPCPTTIFTLGLLMLARPSAGWGLFAIPLAWTVVGGSAAALLGVAEDFGLIAAGVAAVAVLALTNHGRTHEAHA